MLSHRFHMFPCSTLYHLPRFLASPVDRPSYSESLLAAKPYIELPKTETASEIAVNRPTSEDHVTMKHVKVQVISRANQQSNVVRSKTQCHDDFLSASSAAVGLMNKNS